MKVFISWSGALSREVAVALHDWLPSVIQDAKPFVSSEDIEAGQRWSDALGTELSEAAYGIICITLDNFNAPWLHFEAGAVSKALDKSYVSPFLFNIEPMRIAGPLRQFQFTEFERNGVFNLMRSVNNRLQPDHRLPDDLLRKEFDVWWPDLKAKLDVLAKRPAAETHSGYAWLYTMSDLAAIQRDSRCDSVWVITPDLYNNILSQPLRDVIQDGLARGAVYTVVIPKSDDMDAAKEGLRRLATGKAGTIHISEIPHEEFRNAAVTDYLVTNPDANSMQVFLELPVKEHGFWIKVNEQAALGLVVRFRRMAQP
jgi:hypothetical protein